MTKSRGGVCVVNIDFNKVVPAGDLRGEDEKDTSMLRGMLSEARQFLISFHWCRSVKQAYFGFGIGGVVAVFLFGIEPAQAGVDEWLWVIVGDVPPAYLVTDDCPTPKAALDEYVIEMSRWVAAAKKNQSTKDLIPVTAPATPENVKALSGRLEFIRNKILSTISE
jgi:hypothetical protein